MAKAIYAVSGDGHFLGHDGFAVPKTSAEFQRRFPQWIQSYVSLRGVAPSDRDDMERRIVSYLGSPAGLEDAPEKLQEFSPETTSGCDAFRFFNWLIETLDREICD